METYTVACMKWGTKYGPEYVNRLFNMVSRNTTLDFKFICFTDDATGLLPEIQALPLPPMNLPDGKERGWRKLSLFQGNIGLEGRVLFIDLDIVIVSNIDNFFTAPGDFIFIKHWKPSKKQGIGQTAVYRFEANKFAFLFEYFMEHIDEVKANYRHEQAYVSDMLNKRGLINFWPEEWMPSFKYKCMYPFPLNLFMKPVIPTNAKMIIFHGNPTPDQALAGKTKGSFKKFIRHVKTPDWLKKNWN